LNSVSKPTLPPALQVQRLRDNWLETAADVAALSREDAAALSVPLKVWSYIGSTLASAADGPATEGARADAAAEEAAEGAETPGRSEGGGDGAAELHPDIMQRRAPPRRRLFSRAHVRVTRRTKQAPYGLRVRFD
jgi:hypothetical protein